MEGRDSFAVYQLLKLGAVTSHLGDNQLGDTSRSTRRQLISFECLFRIDRTKQVEQESRVSYNPKKAGNKLSPS